MQAHRMSLALNPEIFRSVLESLPIGVYLVDRNRQIVFWNSGAESITGYLGQEVIGHYCHDNLLMHCDQKQEILCGDACPLMQTMLDGKLRDCDVFLRHKDGQRVPVRVRAMPVRDEWGTIIGSAEFFEERSCRASETRPCRARMGTTLDELTDLPDYQSVLAGFGLALERFEASKVPFGIVCVGIDNIDHLRHFEGLQGLKAVLYATGQTLAQSTRPSDMVGRWHTERFAAMIACPTSAALRSCAERVQRLMNLAAVPWWGERLSVTVSMGGTMAREGDTVESLTRRAEEALEASLAQKKNAILVV